MHHMSKRAIERAVTRLVNSNNKHYRICFHENFAEVILDNEIIASNSDTPKLIRQLRELENEVEIEDLL